MLKPKMRSVLCETPVNVLRPIELTFRREKGFQGAKADDQKVRRFPPAKSIRKSMEPLCKGDEMVRRIREGTTYVICRN